MFKILYTPSRLPSHLAGAWFLRISPSAINPLSLDRRRIVHFISYQSPWQNGCVERVIGSLRRECLDHVIVFGERHLRRVLREYIAYYQESRTHLGPGKDAPEPRAIQPPNVGPVASTPFLGGLHHRCHRNAA